MKFFTLWMIVVASGLSGCGSVSQVVGAGRDAYMVSASGGVFPYPTSQKVYAAANAHCDGMGKTMEPVSTNERPYSVSLTFTCK